MSLKARAIIVVILCCAGVYMCRNPTPADVRALVPAMFKLGPPVAFIAGVDCFFAEFEVLEEPSVDPDDRRKAGDRLSKLLPFERRPPDYQGLHLQRGDYLIFTGASLVGVVNRLNNLDIMSDAIAEMFWSVKGCLSRYDDQHGTNKTSEFRDLFLDDGVMLLLLRPRGWRGWHVAPAIYKDRRLRVFGFGV
ncbi:hypothetical protein [Labrys sp. ZIDIC5]|uniref:hypothetical protein n=1 Tax=Labrys sedimenti TaxID=3106036 RepID=UPI002ACB0514|nr:hypothetical protein [Labrys sp. ZIDIC5]MDZ5450126.1 hypothetical protein [Labrys sp. ZIDIC5]